MNAPLHPLSVKVSSRAHPFALDLSARVRDALGPQSEVSVEVLNGRVTLLGATERSLERAIAAASRSVADLAADQVCVGDVPGRTPYYQLELLVPDEYIGDVFAELNNRGAWLDPPVTVEAGIRFGATIPLVSALGCEETLQQITRGRAEVKFIFVGYRP